MNINFHKLQVLHYLDGLQLMMIFEILHGGELETCLDRLLTIAKNQGASDNVTVVLMQNL